MAGQQRDFPQPAAEDFEPIEDLERYEAAFGYHYLGREDETRAELALLFDPRWIVDTSFGQVVAEHLLAAFAGLDVCFTHWGDYVSPDHSPEELFEAFAEHARLIRSFDYPCHHPLYVVAISTPGHEVQRLLRSAADYPPYVGHANMSWPNTFRTIVNQSLMATWEIAYMNADDASHWIHSFAP